MTTLRAGHSEGRLFVAGCKSNQSLYLPDFGKAVRHLRDYNGDIGAWWSGFRSRTAFTKPATRLR